MLVSLKSSAAVFIATLCVLTVSYAAPPERAHGRHDTHRDARGYVLDDRYNHNRYYPPRGHVVPAAPRGASVVWHRRVPYYFHEGIWYRSSRGPSGTRFVVIAPPIGMFVSVLPPFYTTIWWRDVPYYYADDVYYVWRPDRRGYVVSEPPGDDAEVTTQPAAGGDLFIYPKNGQSEEQQAKDRYECHGWASKQAGFDPTQPFGGVKESEVAVKRADYRRAMTVCLEARGYSVK